MSDDLPTAEEFVNRLNAARCGRSPDKDTGDEPRPGSHADFVRRLRKGLFSDDDDGDTGGSTDG